MASRLSGIPDRSPILSTNPPVRTGRGPQSSQDSSPCFGVCVGIHSYRRLSAWGWLSSNRARMRFPHSPPRIPDEGGNGKPFRCSCGVALGISSQETECPGVLGRDIRRPPGFPGARRRRSLCAAFHNNSVRRVEAGEMRRCDEPWTLVSGPGRRRVNGGDASRTAGARLGVVAAGVRCLDWMLMLSSSVFFGRRGTASTVGYGRKPLPAWEEQTISEVFR